MASVCQLHYAHWKVHFHYSNGKVLSLGFQVSCGKCVKYSLIEFVSL